MTTCDEANIVGSRQGTNVQMKGSDGRREGKGRQRRSTLRVGVGDTYVAFADQLLNVFSTSTRGFWKCRLLKPKADGETEEGTDQLNACNSVLAHAIAALAISTCTAK